MVWNDVLPPRGSVATDYPNIRRALRPTDEDMSWADLVALVDPKAMKRAGIPPMPPLPDPDISKRVKTAARRAGVTEASVVNAVMGMIGSNDAWLSMNVLLIGPADLSAKVMLIAAEENKRVLDLWAGRTQ